MELFREPALRTTITVPQGHPRFRYGDGLLLWGSCFSQEIGALLSRDRFRIVQNPFGIVYNPLVMARQITRLLTGGPMAAEELHFDGELWHSPWHHGSFSRPDRDEALTHINETLAAARAHLLTSTHLVLTLGHTQIFTDKQTGIPVANCHKRPASDFQESQLRLEHLLPAWEALLAELWSHCPEIRIVVTVSPVRYLRNGAIAHSRSKATLHLLAERLEEAGAAYFPSWEIMQDELRDYRYYAPDLIHPSPVATEIIYQRFLQAWFDPAEWELLKTVREWVAMAGHRPRFPGTASHDRMLAAWHAKGDEIARRWPDKVDLVKEPGSPDWP